MKPQWEEYHEEITKAHVKSEEGYREDTYKCTEGHLTGGYGHKMLDGEVPPTDRAGWEAIFDKDFNTAKMGATELVGSSQNLRPQAFGIVIEMVYQMGTFGVSKFKNFLSALNKEEPDYELASKEMLDSRWAKQTPNRAERMSDRMAEIATKHFG